MARVAHARDETAAASDVCAGEMYSRFFIPGFDPRAIAIRIPVICPDVLVDQFSFSFLPSFVRENEFIARYRMRESIRFSLLL